MYNYGAPVKWRPVKTVPQYHFTINSAYMALGLKPNLNNDNLIDLLIHGLKVYQLLLTVNLCNFTQSIPATYKLD
jgi:hypothetical protein